MADRPLDSTRLTVTDAARMLGVGETVIQADLEAGAPANPDGTINLVRYAAWLLWLLNRREPPDG